MVITSLFRNKWLQQVCFETKMQKSGYNKFYPTWFKWRKSQNIKSIYQNLFSNAEIFNSATDGVVTVVKKANFKKARKFRPNLLKIRVLDIAYKGDIVEVLIEKKYFSSTYSDITTKKITIDYSKSNKGPQIIREYPYFTKRI